MDKQPFDHMENRIRQAADNISPPFNEEAWRKMELLLDGEDKKKKRGFIWWWYLLFSGLIVGVALLYFNYKGESRLFATDTSTQSPVIVRKEGSLDSQSPARSSTNLPSNEMKQGVAERPSPITGGIISAPSSSIETLTSKDEAVKKSSSGLRYETELTGPSRKSGVTGKNNPRGKQNEKLQVPGAGLQASIASTDRFYQQDLSEKDNIVTKEQAGEASPEKPSTVAADSSIAKTNEPHVDLTQTKEPATADSIKKIQKLPIISKAKFASPPGFYIIASAGIDAVSLRKLSLKTFQPVYGGTVGYRFNKRLSVQTGFYSGKRIYTAGPDDYTVKSGSYVARIISADAICQIYDIPLTVRYDFLRTRHANIFVGTGFSSYIMKRETYDMHFFNPTGMYRRMVYSYTSNKDFFAIYNLSVGYEHRISKSISALAEPYLKLPLSGVGEGNVKLYSGGIQVGLKYQPAIYQHHRKISK